MYSKSSCSKNLGNIFLVCWSYSNICLLGWRDCPRALTMLEKWSATELSHPQQFMVLLDWLPTKCLSQILSLINSHLSWFLVLIGNVIATSPIILQERNLHSCTLWPRIPQGVNKSWLQITNLNQCDSKEIFILFCVSSLWEFTFVYSIFWSFISPHPIFNFSQIPHCKPPPPASFHIIYFLQFLKFSYNCPYMREL